MAPLEKRGSKVIVPPHAPMRSTYYSDEECELAVKGVAIPQALGHKVMEVCTVRGIRQHWAFGTELRGSLPIFTRALNARQIMNGIVLEMNYQHEIPYCIWYPTTSSEITYREVAMRYPSMKYQVGRACAVAGYTDLYRELDPQPDVQIAEEARDNGSDEIYDLIMKHRDKFPIMDDYNLKVHNDRSTQVVSHLSGDTAVRSSLDVTQQFGRDKYDLWEDIYFNITKDLGFDTSNYKPPAVITAERLAIQYLDTPLPPDLPPLQKDILIVVAA